MSCWRPSYYPVKKPHCDVFRTELKFLGEGQCPLRLMSWGQLTGEDIVRGWLVAAAVSLLFSCVAMQVYFGVFCSSQLVF